MKVCACRRPLVAALAFLAVLGLAACRSGNRPKPAPPIAEAWAGPVTLNLRAEIQPKSKTVASVKHGERLDILQIRRRFVRVRTPGGGEGWTEMRNLLNAGQMEDLRKLAKDTAAWPSQGEATVYETLNMHSEPSRISTSFYQIVEGARVDVLARQMTPRTTEQPKPAFRVSRPAPPPRKRREPAIPPPPRPPGPGLPPNWRELSQTTMPPEPEAEIPLPSRAGPPKARLDDWTLVRTKDGKAGWALTRNLIMAIPDEVAQYSEGARITSYFALRAVQDEGITKHHWIWTTLRDTGVPFEFDSFRVFVYVVRRHRYETAYIERNVEGYYPVEVTPGAMPKFSLVFREPDGRLVKKSYVLEGYIVRKTGEIPWRQTSKVPGEVKISAVAPEDEGGEDDEKPSLVDRIRGFFTARRDP